jgi:molybdopterin-guanine dinucleotide biosynthesis protein A
VVLVGGKSRRFGRDKLREPVGGGNGQERLVDRPIAALRACFGPRVAVVGECDAAVAARADRVIPDLYPGRGPLGGILSALEQSAAAVFVLAGDLPAIDDATVRAIMGGAELFPDAWAVLGAAPCAEWCIGLWRPAAVPMLRERLARGQLSLRSALPADKTALVPVEPGACRNANTPAEL